MSLRARKGRQILRGCGLGRAGTVWRKRASPFANPRSVPQSDTLLLHDAVPTLAAPRCAAYQSGEGDLAAHQQTLGRRALIDL